MKRFLLMTLFLSVGFALPGYSDQGGMTVENEASSGHPVARFSSWVLFSGGRVVQGSPFLAYGYLSEIGELPQLRQSLRNESSAVLTFVVEGTARDMRRGEGALLIESQGTLRVFFDPQGKRDFTEPKSFRTGKEVATYTLQRQVLFNPEGGWLYDRSFAQLTSSQNFTIQDTEINFLRLWGTRLALRAQARAGDGLPSPVPEFSGAIPYLGQVFIDGERTEYHSPARQEDVQEDQVIARRPERATLSVEAETAGILPSIRALQIPSPIRAMVLSKDRDSCFDFAADAATLSMSGNFSTFSLLLRSS